MTEGTVRDIRTGRAIAKTASLTASFAKYIQAMLAFEKEFYVVYGKCRHADTREMVSGLKSLEGFPVIYDPQMPADTAWIFEGKPEELGFAS